MLSAAVTHGGGAYPAYPSQEDFDQEEEEDFDDGEAGSPRENGSKIRAKGSKVYEDLAPPAPDAPSLPRRGPPSTLQGYLAHKKQPPPLGPP